VFILRKIITYLAIFALLISLVSAQDISVKINGNDISEEIEITPNSELKIDTTIAPNTYIESVTAESKNEIIRQIIEEELKSFERDERNPESEVKSRTVHLPSVLPGGTHKVSTTFKYSNANLESKEENKQFNFKVTSAGFSGAIVGILSGLISDDGASEVVDLITNRQVKPVPRELSNEEIRGIADELGLTEEDIKNKNYNIEEVDRKESPQDSLVDQLITEIDNQKAKETLEEIRKSKTPDIKKELIVYKISTKDGLKSAHQSKTIVGITHEKSLNRIDLIENIPKTTAESADKLIFSEQPEILVNDPVVKWNFDHVPKGQTKEVSYTVNKKLDKIESTSAAGGKEPGFFANIIAKIIGMFVK
jgi:hypothetical protein